MNFSMKKFLFGILFLFLLSASVNAQSDILNRYRLGQSYEQAGEYNKAKSIYKALIKIQPWNNLYLQALNRIYLQLKEYNNSILLLKNKIKTEPGNIALYGLLGTTYFTMGKNKKAFAAWDSAIKLNPKNVVAYKIIADYVLKNRAFDKAVEILIKGKKISGNPIIFSYELANIYSVTLKYTKAAEEYCDIIAQEPSQLNTIQSRFASFINNNGAFKPLIKVIKEKYRSTKKPVFLKLLVFMYRQKKEYKKAFKVIKQLESIKPDNGLRIFNFAQSLFYDNEYKTAAKAYQYLMSHYPNSQLIGTAKLGYARTMETVLDSSLNSNNSWKPLKAYDTLGNYQYKKIVSAYIEISKMYPASSLHNEADYWAAHILIEKLKKYSEAKRLLKTIIKNSPYSNYAIISEIKLAQLNILENNFVKSKKYLFDILNNVRAPASVKNKANYMLGKILFWNGKFKNASKILDKVSEKFSSDYSNDAIALKIIITLQSDSLTLSLFAKADLLTYQQKLIQASKIYRKLFEKNNLFLLDGLTKYKFAETLVALNNFPEAITVLDTLINSKKPSILKDKAVYLLANIYYYGVHNINEALHTYEKLLEKFPNSLYLNRSRQMIIHIKKLKSIKND